MISVVTPANVLYTPVFLAVFFCSIFYVISLLFLLLGNGNLFS